MKNKKLVKRGRPPKLKQNVTDVFDPSLIKLIRGSELSFSDSLFKPMKTNSEMDIVLSTEGGIMPATNMVLVGGPGSGKSTIALDMLSNLTTQGYKCLFVSAEMDEITFYKYCKRLPKFDCVQTLFLKNHHDTLKETLEYVFNEGYDVICIDSLAEVIEMYRSVYKTTESKAEHWFLSLQDHHKQGNNNNKYYTSFINIQQVTKGNEFVGSNKLKHLTSAMCHIERSKDDLQRKLYFSKNRDCDKDFEIFFTIHKDQVYYSYENTLN